MSHLPQKVDRQHAWQQDRGDDNAELARVDLKYLVLIAARRYESMDNLELYIIRVQHIISSVKVSQGEVLKPIKSFDMGIPTGMTAAKMESVYYMQRKGESPVN